MKPDPALLAALDLLAGVVRSMRLSFGWSQRDLSLRSGVAQSQISLLERHRLDDIRLSDVARMLGPLGIPFRLVVDLPHVQARQVDLVHAWCVGAVCRRLQRAGWILAREVEVGGDRSRGWIDILAFHPSTRRLLVIEVKTELRDLGQIERTMNWYQREAWTAARRLGWRPDTIRSALLVLGSNDNDRFLDTNRTVVGAAFPARARDLMAVVNGSPIVGASRSVAMIDPKSRRAQWLRPTRLDGRRTPAPYEDYLDAARTLGARSRGPVRRPGSLPRSPGQSDRS